ncbi:MAG: hypothetical protein D6701_10925 [Gemmatimonadetes bacterium]|nr:MAG: hypothetical protein D6701_10925 [Gemmatimonadota bacterium]
MPAPPPHRWSESGGPDMLRRAGWAALRPTLPLTAFVALWTAACGRDAADPYTGFCEAVQERVAAHLASLDADAGRSPEHAERYGGTLVVGGPAELGDMNPLTSGNYTARQVQNAAVFHTLLRLADDLRTYEPHAAESFELSDDRTTLTFRLRDDLRWHDGEPLTARDVAFTFERATDPETGFPNEQYFTRYDSVVVVDGLTVRFHLRPHAEPLEPWRATGIVPEHLLADVPPADLARHPFATRCPVGSGPFRVVEHLESDRWTLEANPAHAPGLGGRPFFDRVVYRIVPDPTTLASELLTGAVDVFTDMGASVVPIVARPDGSARVVAFPGRSYVYVAWNTRRPQFEDARVRRALTMAVNRADLVAALFGGLAIPADGPVPPFHYAFDPALLEGVNPYDPERASALLDEAGWVDSDGDGIRDRDGVPLSFTLRTNAGSREKAGAMEILQAQWAEVGVRAQPEVIEFNTLIDRMIQRDFDAAVMTWIVDFSLDERNLFDGRDTRYDFAWTGIYDEELDRLLDAIPEAPSREAAKPLWDAYQLRLAELQPYTYLWFSRRLVGINRAVRDARMDVRNDLLDLHRWWIAAADRR